MVGLPGHLKDPHTALDRHQQRRRPLVHVHPPRQVASLLQGADAYRQVLLPAVHQPHHYRVRPGRAAAQVLRERRKRTPVALLLVPLDHHIPPLLPGLPRVQTAQVGLLVLQDLLGLEPGDREQQVLLTPAEVVEQLALARVRAGNHLVEGGLLDAPLTQHQRRALDDAVPGRPALGRQLLAHDASLKLDWAVPCTPGGDPRGRRLRAVSAPRPPPTPPRRPTAAPPTPAPSPAARPH